MNVNLECSHKQLKKQVEKSETLLPEMRISVKKLWKNCLSISIFSNYPTICKILERGMQDHQSELQTLRKTF